MNVPSTRPVAVGIDGSAESQAALEWAAREATRRGLPLRLAHAWMEETLFVPTPPDETVARRLLDQAAAEVSAGHPELSVTTRLVPDTAASGLVSESSEAELLVLGSRGHGAVIGFLLGSVSQPVIAHAACPVVSVRATEARRTTEGDEVVVGLRDLGPDSGRLLDFAFTSAAVRGAAVRAVHVWGAPSMFGSDVPDMLQQRGHQPVEDQQAALLSEALAPWRERHPSVRVAERLRFGNASEELLAATSHGAAMVVVGRRLHRPRLSPHIGGVAHAALHHAACPVAVVPYG
ncbi:universal stress protein [Streptomyces sp. 8K308]|uniref:universal stress protein n=1 Tax=Streptomyces sp. 8K308 TaxID=2530388 RepID=UPI00104494C7|nr:universal stress protein [Streptomyces sp. 8K308]TDC21397.1 universal stress protein [Streptomyces sp. 8K308]